MATSVHEEFYATGGAANTPSGGASGEVPIIHYYVKSSPFVSLRLPRIVAARRQKRNLLGFALRKPAVSEDRKV